MATNSIVPSGTYHLYRHELILLIPVRFLVNTYQAFILFSLLSSRARSDVELSFSCSVSILSMYTRTC